VVDLAGADLAGADFGVTDLTGADFSGANLAGANFYVAILEGADFSGAHLAGAGLIRANLEGADLAGANLRGANLYGAILWGANLTGADLAAAYLDGADLTGANLVEANLTGVDLIRANLTGADLAGANLVMADLTGVNLYGATADQNTRWPDGFDPVAAGVAFTTTEAPPADLVPNPVLEACVTGILGDGYDDIDATAVTAKEWDAAMLAHTAAVSACTLEMVQDDAGIMAAAAAFRSCMLTQLDAFGITADVHPVLPHLITPWKALTPGHILQWDELFGPCNALRSSYDSLTVPVFFVEASSL
jgi:hypothetical protein